MGNLPMKTLVIGSKTYEIIDNAARTDVANLKSADETIKNSINNLSALIGDTSVADQLEDVVNNINTILDETSDKIESVQNVANTAVTNASTAQTTADNAQNTADTHIANISNPHNVTKTQVGLGNVDDVKQMPITGGEFAGDVVATSTNRDTASLRNVEVRTSSVSGTLQSTNKIVMIRK